MAYIDKSGELQMTFVVQAETFYADGLIERQIRSKPLGTEEKKAFILKYRDRKRAQGGHANTDRLIEPGLSIYCSKVGDSAPLWQAQFHDRGGDEMEIVRLEIFSDGFAAFAQFPAFFQALATDPPRSLLDVRALLTRLGAVDVTPRHPRTTPTNTTEEQ